jgi:hypothetical protein
MDALEVPEEVARCSFSRNVELNRPLILGDLLLPMLHKDFILFLQVCEYLELYSLVLHLDHLNQGNSLNRYLPLHLVKLYFTSFLVEVAFCVIHEDH